MTRLWLAGPGSHCSRGGCPKRTGEIAAQGPSFCMFMLRAHCYTCYPSEVRRSTDWAGGEYVLPSQHAGDERILAVYLGGGVQNFGDLTF